MKFPGLQIEKSDLVPQGCWCLWAGDQMISVVSKGRRDFLAKFGLKVELPVSTTKILVDPEEYSRLASQLSHLQMKGDRSDG